MTTQVLSKVRLGQDSEDGGPSVMNYTMQYCLSQAGQSSGSGPKDWPASDKPCCIIYFMTLSTIMYQLLITHSHAFVHGDDNLCITDWVVCYSRELWQTDYYSNGSVHVMRVSMDSRKMKRSDGAIIKRALIIELLIDTVHFMTIILINKTRIQNGYDIHLQY